MASSFICELSGDPIAAGESVVTPSGHVCAKSLLLSKLADNGGVDPFHEKKPLSEDDLIELSTAGSKIMPPRVSANSMPQLLQLLGTEYQNLVQELFDTRKLLEETRKELSQSLYQNDASIRVIARLAMERDAARAELSKWKAGEVSTPAEAVEEPSNKRARVNNEVKANSIPAEHLELMTQSWQQVSQARKANKKQIAANAPSKEQLEELEETKSKSYHKTSGKQGIVAMATDGTSIVTASKNKQVCVFDKESEQVVNTFSPGGLAEYVDVVGTITAMAVPDKKTVLLMDGEEQKCKISVEDESIVGLSLHPSKQHLVICTTNKIHLYGIDGQHLTFFESSQDYLCGKLHPDGLIYCAATSDGKLDLWDFKSQKLASTMGSGGAAMESIEFSPNGYHLATVGDSEVTVWDLKKQASIASLKELPSPKSCAFDAAGKYLAYGGKNGVVVTTVKEWGVTCRKEFGGTSVAWVGSSELVACLDNKRAVKFYGLADTGVVKVEGS